MIYVLDVTEYAMIESALCYYPFTNVAYKAIYSVSKATKPIQMGKTIS